MLLQELTHKQLIPDCPEFILDNIHYMTVMGSIAYGCETDYSDFDIYGFCVPPKDIIFPHLAGVIQGFGTPPPRFEQWQKHHILDKEAVGGKGREYDFSIYNIIQYFQLCMQNNPNMIDSLFTPQTCVLHCTLLGGLVRDNRKLFLHKGSWFKFKGYAYSQMHKMKSQTREGKRKETVEHYGYDIKFAAHCVRLLNEVEQILVEHDLDLQRNREQLKSIRRGEWTLEQVEEYFATKEKQLEEQYTKSTLRHVPDEEAIKKLLLQCLETHYGSLDKAIVIPGREQMILRQIKELVKGIE